MRIMGSILAIISAVMLIPVAGLIMLYAGVSFVGGRNEQEHDLGMVIGSALMLLALVLIALGLTALLRRGRGPAIVLTGVGIIGSMAIVVASVMCIYEALCLLLPVFPGLLIGGIMILRAAQPAQQLPPGATDQTRVVDA
jgi:hypothetical protein